LIPGPTKVFETRRLAAKPKSPLDRGSQIGVVAPEETRRPIAVAAPVERIVQPTGKVERVGLGDRRVGVHRTEHRENFRFHELVAHRLDAF
jgi:hypothetical protein